MRMQKRDKDSIRTVDGLEHKPYSAAGSQYGGTQSLLEVWGAQAIAKGSLWCILWAFQVFFTAVHRRLRWKVLQILHNIFHDPHQDASACISSLN